MGGQRKSSSGGGKGAGGNQGRCQSGKKMGQKSPWICITCEEAVNEDDNAIECHDCKEWCHKGCSSLTGAQFNCLKTSGDFIQWFCETCRGTEMKDAGSKSRMEATINGIWKMLVAVNERLDRIEESYSGQSLDEKIQKAVNEKVQECMEETRERERRRLNIVVCNIPESTRETLEERKKEDKDRVRDIITQISDVPREEIDNPVRLGPIQVGNKTRPRLLKLEVKNEDSKRKIMKNASKLHNPETPPQERIYINNDSTPKERNLFRQLKQELKRRREEGETDIIIDYRTGKIIKRTEKTDKQYSGTDSATANADAGQGPREKN